MIILRKTTAHICVIIYLFVLCGTSFNLQEDKYVSNISINNSEPFYEYNSIIVHYMRIEPSQVFNLQLLSSWGKMCVHNGLYFY